VNFYLQESEKHQRIFGFFLFCENGDLFPYLFSDDFHILHKPTSMSEVKGADLESVGIRPISIPNWISLILEMTMVTSNGDSDQST